MRVDVRVVSFADDPILRSGTTARFTAILDVTGLAIFSTPLASSIARVVNERLMSLCAVRDAKRVCIWKLNLLQRWKGHCCKITFWVVVVEPRLILEQIESLEAARALQEVSTIG